MNIFEGSRRVSKLIAILWAGGVCVSWFSSDAYIAAHYWVLTPGEPPFYMGEPDCGFGDKTVPAPAITALGSSVQIDLCFKPTKFENGRELIPYRSDGKLTWGDESYSDNVTQYAENVAFHFKPSSADGRLIEQLVRDTRSKRLRAHASTLVAGLVAIWAFTACIGWIVRGFMSIPRGQDHRTA